MKLYSSNEDYKLYQGNMLDMLNVIDKETIDSIITDPPYELNFMGKGWDNSGIAFNLNEQQREAGTGILAGYECQANENGRFPANTILTYDETDFDEVCGGFPNTKGDNRTSKPTYDKSIWGNAKSVESKCLYADSGSASRYFYTAKASKKDRDEGLDTFNQEKVNDDRQTPIDNPFQRGETPRRNVHPCVKPTNLMQYLVRLVTPNNGIVLDPFNGSGSTGKAVMYENKERNKNYKYIGIELTEEYLPISKARIEYVCNLKPEINPQISIFDLEDNNE